MRNARSARFLRHHVRKTRVWDLAGLKSRPLDSCPQGPRQDLMPDNRALRGLSLKKASFSSGDKHHIVALNEDASEAHILSAIDYQPVEQPIAPKPADEGTQVEIKQALFSRDQQADPVDPEKCAGVAVGY